MRRIQRGYERNPFTLAFDVVVTPLPLHACRLDGQVCIGGVFHGDNHFGGRQGHQDHDDKRNDGPDDLNGHRLVKIGSLVSFGFAVFPDGIKHHCKHSHKNDGTDNQHEPVKPRLLHGNTGHRRMQIQLVHGRPARQIIDSMCRTDAQTACGQNRARQLIENVLDHVHFFIASNKPYVMPFHHTNQMPRRAIRISLANSGRNSGRINRPTWIVRP